MVLNNSRWCVVAACIALTLLTDKRVGAQAVNVVFDGVGLSNWNVDGNWNPNFVPDGSLNEVAVIGSPSNVFVQDTPISPGGLIMDLSSLEIRSGGNVTAVPGSEATGNLVIGQSGITNATVRRGGTLVGRDLTLGGAAVLTLGETGGSGVASLTVTSATLGARTRVVGPNVAFTSTGPVTFGGTSVLNPVITGTTHSTITATGAAFLDGVVRPELNGFTPALGNSWTLVTGSTVTGSFELDPSQLPETPRGTGFYLTKTATAARLNYSNLLILNVDRGTGAVKIENAVGGPIAIHGYTIASTDNVLDGPWNSLQDQALAAWDEADNSGPGRLTEFKTAGSTNVAVGAPLSLGSPYSPPAPTALGEQPGANVSFQYLTPDGSVVDGIVEITGAFNNLVLTIDPATGEAAIQNESPHFDVSIDAYTITSASGKLLMGNGAWNSLQDQGLAAWDQADNSNANRITEFKTSGATAMAGGGTVLDLGAPINLGAGALEIEDFGFEFKLSTGQTLAGVIEFGAIPGFEPPGGDYNGDGAVNGNDFLVWQRALGSNVAAGTGADGSGNGVIDAADLTVWRNGFGSATAATSGAVAAVPEPATLGGALALLGMVAWKRRRSA